MAAQKSGPDHIFSIDVECWYEILSRGGRAQGEFRGDRFDRQMEVVLELLAETKTKATFFVLASVARERPMLAAQLVALGHEVGTHGSAHIALTLHSPASFRADISDSKRLLEDQSGQPVRSHRAPMFSVVENNLWVLDVLAEAGLTIDSSICPSRLSRFSVPSFARRPTAVRGPGGGRIFEVPVSTVQMLGSRWPVSGGSYARILPSAILQRVPSSLAREKLPLVLYFHPYEFDPEPLVPPPPYRGWRKVYTERRWNAFRSSILPKMKRLLKEHRFGRMDDYVAKFSHE